MNTHTHTYLVAFSPVSVTASSDMSSAWPLICENGAYQSIVKATKTTPTPHTHTHTPHTHTYLWTLCEQRDGDCTTATTQIQELNAPS